MRRGLISRLVKLEQRAARRPAVRVKPPSTFNWRSFHRVSARLLGEPEPSEAELDELDALALAEPLAPQRREPFDWGELTALTDEMYGQAALREPPATP